MFIGASASARTPRRLPRLHARVLQGLPLPRLRLGHPRAAPRAGHAQDGRPAQEDAHHRLDLRPVDGLAIAGFPLLSGFFSKDEILWKVFSNQNTLIPGWVFWLVAVAGAMCTAFYMVRVYALTFVGTYRGEPAQDAAHGHDAHDAHGHDDHGHGHHGGVKFKDIHESPWTMTLPLVILAIGAVFGGFLGLPHWVPGHPTNFFDHWLEPVFESATKAVSVGLAALSAAAAWFMYAGNGKHLPEQIATRFRPIYRAVYNKYYVDEIYAFLIVNPIKAFARFCWRWVDDGLIDGVLVNGPAAIVNLTGRVVRLFTTGDVQRYAFFVLGGVWLLVVVWLAE
jgi:NADH-quinone oxidoreductase subunit L